MNKDSIFTPMFDVYVKLYCLTNMSVMELSNEMEMKILQAAEKVFYMKGKQGTSMQDIADEAGITRTSLNYYYRSKDKLFEAVFRKTMAEFVPKIASLMYAAPTMSDYIPKMVEIIIDNMIEKPQIPLFVLSEPTSHPERVPQMISEMGIHPAEAMEKMSKDQEFSKLSIDPRQLIINVLSMCIFPFAAKPMLMSLLFQGNEEEYIESMKQRKEMIPQIIEQMMNLYKS